MKKTVKTGTAPASGTARARRPTQAERSQATRERVIAAAISLLHREGYSGATTLAIRREADVSMGAMQHQFPTKAELMAAVQERLTGDRFAQFERAARSATTPLERIDRMLDVAGVLIGTPLFAASMEIQLARRADKELDEAVTRILRPFGEGFRALMDDAVAGFDRAIALKITQLQLLAGSMIRGLTIDVVTGSDPAVARAAFALWREIALRHITDMAQSPAPAPTKTGKRRASR
ncbi:TetR/AcrR family transcriptional regulator [Burkholderia cenocepacia]|uniref:TetR/AcrR family transcriptional regulator n=1 Tax=Burkholderia sola TaxID=2843302 RepID=A0ABV2C6A1_9BURK|nr:MULTISPECIES: TetR/AcrR family transcriptional regulator [unclassified Burkholderia]RQU39946.1 TetR/AcrR family transcriptional regulator [Burkholderia cenocepacia]MBP0606326.1 TetR/AcrR family transcriptional regulator [Burkholderia sp. CpTa8-5]MBP0713106.1 TetR/AcrR family transcriptional regulator [Burkholderia sp. AcTa6-5]OXI68980.1 TetR family transcriptional regulator [Burkholderia sp. AU31280]RQU70207.1 TetR/AcrR family transcriptional regulator [Burkholderia cenocepacia]